MAVIVIKHAFNNNGGKLPDIQFRIQAVILPTTFSHIWLHPARKENRGIGIDSPEMLLYDAFQICTVGRRILYPNPKH